MKREVVLDTTVLGNISSASTSEMDLFSLIGSLGFTFLIPEEVKNEFSRYQNPNSLVFREKILNRINVHSRAFQLCTIYDAVTLEMVRGKKGIDKGEAEAIAQARKRKAYIIITDDVNCVRRIEKGFDAFSFQFYDTLFLIALLDIQGLLTNYNLVIMSLHSTYPFPSSKVRLAYVNAYKYLGININTTLKKRISQRCSLKTILS